MGKNFDRAASRACRRLFRSPVVRAEHPGGRSRDSIRVILRDRSVIVTRRNSERRALLESEVLRELGTRNAPVPRILGFDGMLMIQEDLGEQRLSVAVANAEKAVGFKWLDKGLHSLAAIHRAGHEAGLEERVATLGQEREWLQEFVETPERLARHCGIAPPRLAVDSLIDHLEVVHPHFIKWDARPANAIAREDGQVAWMDWEHCGCRNRLDDMVWLLCDEFVPDWPDVEDKLIASHLPAFADGLSVADAKAYLFIFGTFHMCVRLALILSNKKDDPWWDGEYCLTRDKVGVTLEASLGTCRRAARWAGKMPLTEPIVPWLDDVSDWLKQQS